MIDVTALDSVDSLVVVSAEDREILARYMTLTNLDGGDVLIHEGRPSPAAHLLLEGTVHTRRYIDDPRGKLTYSGVVPQGEWFGIVSVLDNKPASADVIAAGKVAVGTLSHADLDQLAHAHPGTAARLLRTWLRSLAYQVRRINARNVEMLQLAARLR